MSTDATIVIKGRNELSFAVAQAERQLRGLARQGELLGKVLRGGAIVGAFFAFERLAESAEKAAKQIGDKGTAGSLKELNREVDKLKAKGVNVIGQALGETFALVSKYTGGTASDLSIINAEISRLEAHLKTLDLTGITFGRDKLVEEIRLLKERRDLYASALPRGQRERAPGGQGGRGRSVSIPVDIETDSERAKRLKEEMDALLLSLERHAPAIAEQAEAVRRYYEGIEQGVQSVETVQQIAADGLEEVSHEMEETFEDWFASTDEMTVFAEQAAREMQSSFAQFLFDPFKEGLDGMLAGFIDVVRNMIAQLAAQELLTAFFTWGSGLGGGIGNLSSKLLSGLTPKALGGPVTGGTPYMVGERGPELFVPNTSGSIVPNHAMGGVAMTYHIDARGADAERIMAVMPGLLKRASDDAVARVRDLVGRGKLT
jgi:hypothetical protein